MCNRCSYDVNMCKYCDHWFCMRCGLRYPGDVDETEHEEIPKDHLDKCEFKHRNSYYHEGTCKPKKLCKKCNKNNLCY